MSDFDATADRYEHLVSESITFAGQEHEQYVRRKADALVELATRELGDPRGLRALDVGCGVGLTERFLVDRIGQLHGFDPSSSAVERAARECPGVEFRTSDGGQLPYADEGFDLAFVVNVLHHVPVEERPELVSELRRVVRPGGIAAIFEHNPNNPLTRLAVHRCPFDDDAILLRRKEALSLLRNARMEPVASRYILFFPFERTWSRSVERRLRKLPVGAQFLVAGRR